MSQSFGTTASMARITSRGSSRPGAMSNCIESGGSVAMRCSSSLVRIVAAVGLPAPGFLSRPARMASTPASASDLMYMSAAFCPSRRPRGASSNWILKAFPVMPATDVVGKAGADREHDVRGLVHLPAQRREIAAQMPSPNGWSWNRPRAGSELESKAPQRSASLITASRAPDHNTPRPPRMIGASAWPRLDGLGHELGSGCMRPTLGWYISEVS